MPFPQQRPRRLRQSPTIRAMVRETQLNPCDLIAPMFIEPGENVRKPISSLPGQFRLSPDTAADFARELYEVGVLSVMLFGVPDEKDETGSHAADMNGPVPLAARAIKDAVPEMCVIADVCACEYTSHGHCGILDGETVDNDATLPVLAGAAVAYARAGCDMVAPSDMMDGRVAAIRVGLDEAGFQNVPIISYAAKFAGAFYGPFREAADSAPSFGDRRSYQMDISNGREAMREMALDVEEGADMLVIKPALFCLDLIHQARQKFDLPVCAYHVSSEYAMIKAAAARGWIDERNLTNESLISIKRAGADLIVTYHALEWAQWRRAGLV